MTQTPPPTSPLDALKPAAGRVLEAALNRAVALDPDTRDALRALDGRRVELALQSPPLALQLRVDGDRLVVGPVETDNEPDLSVRSTLGALLGQLPSLLGSRGDDAPPIGGMRISGDADLARRLQRLAERFDPDWQQPFVAVFGDVVGVQVANGFAAALKQARTLGGEFAGSAAEYVVEESRDVVGRDELAAFHDDVDALRDDFERLAARVTRIDGAAR
ncbi:SCP2 domain-containing protein [Luteimonas soli]|uniref:Ubiquinone biosynthesis accessory factor UbiJ n=1 Tax=Luteimonas soli TaxID=1648966 RepID=A0ABV7XMS9_9GAMM